MIIELLQINDWVYIKDKDLNIYGNYRVECFEKHEEGYGIVVSGRQLVFFDDCVEPISLTADILEKNGFIIEPDGYNYYVEGLLNEQTYVNVAFRKNGGARRVEVRNFRKVFTCDNYPNGLCVHELQHALRLCGLNDLADNIVI